jgi:hypothetical protein
LKLKTTVWSSRHMYNKLFSYSFGQGGKHISLKKNKKQKSYKITLYQNLVNYVRNLPGFFFLILLPGRLKKLITEKTDIMLHSIS